MNIIKSRVKEEENVELNDLNGSLICKNLISFELLLKILCCTDHKSLLSCRLVCKHWYHLIQSFVWRKKAELALNRKLARDESWQTYYYMCYKQPFDRNLIKNHSGADGFDNWVILSGGDKWMVDSALELPRDPTFQANDLCFFARAPELVKYCIVDLLEEGFSGYILDTLQPLIKVSEWYNCGCKHGAAYACEVQFFSDDHTLLKTCKFRDTAKSDDNSHASRWIRFDATLEKYGAGLRRIKFIHSSDATCEHCCKVVRFAGARVELTMPSFELIGKWDRLKRLSRFVARK